MLRAGSFALTALDTVGCLSFVMGDDEIFSLGTEFRLALPPVHHVEDFRNRDAHGAALRAVMALGAGDGLIPVQRLLGRPDVLHLLLPDRQKQTLAKS